MASLVDLMLLCFDPNTPKTLTVREMIDMAGAFPKLAELIQLDQFAKIINSFLCLEVDQEIFDIIESGSTRDPDQSDNLGTIDLWFADIKVDTERLNQWHENNSINDTDRNGLGFEDIYIYKDQLDAWLKYMEKSGQYITTTGEDRNETIASVYCIWAFQRFDDPNDNDRPANERQSQLRSFIVIAKEIEVDMYMVFLTIVILFILRSNEGMNYVHVLSELIRKRNEIVHLLSYDWFMTFPYIKDRFASNTDFSDMIEKTKNVREDTITDEHNIDVLSFLIPLLKDEYKQTYQGAELLRKYTDLIYLKESAIILNNVDGLRKSEDFRNISGESIGRIFNMGKSTGILLGAGFGEEESVITRPLSNVIHSDFLEKDSLWSAISKFVIGQKRWEELNKLYDDAVKEGVSMLLKNSTMMVNNVLEYLMNKEEYKDVLNKETLRKKLKATEVGSKRVRPRGRPRK